MILRLSGRFLILLLAMQLAANAAAAPVFCKHMSQAVSHCRLLHGRARYFSGDGWFTFWPVGTNRLMTIQGNVPPNLSAALRPIDTDYVMGDFEVCPIKKDRPGVSQWVCIATASHLVAVPTRPENQR